MSRIHYECCHHALARFHFLHGRCSLAHAHGAAVSLPERGAEILLALARKHGDSPSFMQLCKNIKSQ
ncbi:MAG: hypothetical protein WBN22_02460 [Verrucomicrobiia bacterium]